MPTYYLAHQNLREIGEKVFGRDIKELGLNYCSKFCLWYRILPSDVIQFIGFKQYSQGFYDTNIAAQPLNIPLFDLSRCGKGEVPCYKCYSDVPVIFWRMQSLKMVPSSTVPRITGLKTDPMDIILDHMKLTYETVAKPVLYNAIDAESCYECYQRVKEIWIRTARVSMGDQKAENEKKMSNLLEIMILGNIGKFQEARRAVEINRELFPRYAEGLSKYVSDIVNNDEERFKRTLKEISEKNITMLKEYGLIK